MSSTVVRETTGEPEEEDERELVAVTKQRGYVREVEFGQEPSAGSWWTSRLGAGPRPSPTSGSALAVEAPPVETPLITVIVPTRNEEGNVNALVRRAAPALKRLFIPWEILFVDDSDDHTPEAIRRAGEKNSVRIIHREPSERVGGLSGAVLAGMQAARGEVIAVMDGDLQHPPEELGPLIWPLLDGTADISVATRYADGGRPDGLAGLWRQVVSRGCRRLVRVALPRTRPVSDPLGGFFAFRREVVEDAVLRPIGFKILLEILARGRWTTVSEIPYDFSRRESGTSKAGLKEGLRFGKHLLRLSLDRTAAAAGDLRPETIDLRAPSDEADVGIDLRDDVATVPARLRALAPRQGSARPLAIPLDDSLRTDLRRFAVSRVQSARAGAVAVIALTALAFHTTLGSLISARQQTTPIAYIGLVPLLAAVLLFAKAMPTDDEPTIQDRQVDLLLGIPLLLCALFTLGIDTRRSPLFWIHRIDVLSLPVFVAGLITLLLGTRAMWRARWAIAFLLLAWPPALRALTNPIATLTAGTGRAVTSLVVQLGLANGGGSNAVYTAKHTGQMIRFSADAGTAQAVVAFALIAAATSLCLTMSWRAKATWLMVGATAVYLFEVGRLVAGPVLPAVLGPGPNLVLALGITGGFVLFAVRRSQRWAEANTETTLAAAKGRPLVVKGMRIAAVAVAAVGALVFISDSSLSRLSHIAGPLGDARIAALEPPPAVGSSRWDKVVFATSAPAFNPGGSNWVRYQEVTDPAGSARPTTVVDVVSASNPDSLSAGNLRNWYPISRDAQQASVTTDLGSGIRASFISFRRSDGVSWLGLTWLWPVKSSGGGHFERVVLLPARIAADVGPTSPAAGWLSDAEMAASRPSLRAMGRSLIATQLGVAASAAANWTEAS